MTACGVDDVPPLPEPSPIVVIPSGTGMWAVQVGSFGNQENAERLEADLRKQGFAAFLSLSPTGSGQLHRILIGPQKDRESAEAITERLSKSGHKRTSRTFSLDSVVTVSGR
jgi:DedD protein